jgi:protein-tyrosine phosphatase
MPIRLDIDWLTDSLAIGGCFASDAVEQLARVLRIACVVDVRAEACDEEVLLRRHGIVLLHLPTADKCAIDPQILRRGVAWVRAKLDAGSRVLIHCQYGIGRSALLALCVLVDRGLSPMDAMTLLKDSRAVASPSPEQIEAFLGFAKERAGQLAEGAPWSVPSFEALARVAYRHLAPGNVGSGSAA